MFNVIVGGVVVEQKATNPNFASGIQVVNDNGQAGVAVGWTYNSGATPPFAAPVPPVLTKDQLLMYADDKASSFLRLSRGYPITGLTMPAVVSAAYTSGEIFDDAGGATAIDQAALATAMSMSLLTFPFAYSDENHNVWSLTQAQLQQFLGAVTAYALSVWAVINGTVIPGVASGSITTTAQIDALAWPT
jgi:hypothetical protein